MREHHETTRKDNRLQIRVNEKTYHVLEKAAHYRHGSVSRFVREASLKEAKKIIQKHETLTLSSQDWSSLLEALSNPVTPNVALQKAYKWYQKTIQK